MKNVLLGLTAVFCLASTTAYAEGGKMDDSKSDSGSMDASKGGKKKSKKKADKGMEGDAAAGDGMKK